MPQPGINHISVAMVKYANSDFQLRQVQHSSANGAEAPFLTHLIELLPKDHEGLCAMCT